MLQDRVFPSAAGLPSPMERLQNRERYSAVLASALYVLFLFMPGAIVGCSVALGQTYGLTVYRFFVSWLFFWVMGLLTLDPFVVRYKSQLGDLINHWPHLLMCTKTCLNVSFEHGLMYYGLLWSLSYLFVLLEAILSLFWSLSAAIEVTTFVSTVCLVLYLVFWTGRVVRRHSQLTYSNKPPKPQTTGDDSNGNVNGNGRFVRVPVRFMQEQKSVEVMLARSATNGMVDMEPDVQLTADARLDLADHAQRNGQQMTFAGNVLTVEPYDALSVEYTFYRRIMWSLLVLLSGCILVLVLRSSFDLFPIDTWVEYVVITLFVVVVLLLVFFLGRKFADPTYLQFFLLLSVYFPYLYGSWLLQTYTTYATEQATMIMILHLLLSTVYLTLISLVIRHFSAPYLYVRFLMLPQVMSYLFEYFIFGFTPWSVQYLLILIISSVHSILTSTGVYWDLWDVVAARLWPPDKTIAYNERRQHADMHMFEHMLSTRYSMQLFAQDTIADVWSMLTVFTLLAVLYGFHIPLQSVMPSFSMEPIVLRVAILLVARVLSWLCSQLIFRYKLERHAPDPYATTNGTTTTTTTVGQRYKPLAEWLDDFLDTFKLSAFRTAVLRSCYEEDMPELFVTADTDINNNNYNNYYPNQQPRLALREIIVMQIAERQWLLHPALLRKHFFYFQAAIYLVLFVVLQSTTGSLPLRYAWFKPSN
jgi:hypothetical protein